MVLPEIVVYYLLVFAGFSSSEAHVMTCVAEYESSFRPAAINTNDNGSLDVGLFQINTVWHNKIPYCELDRLQNPMYNVKCARYVYEVQGIEAWIGYRLNRDKCNKHKVKGVK